jgi:hypothetical protein
MAGALGALIGYLPSSGATNVAPGGPSFPAGATPTTQAIVPGTTTTLGSTETTPRRSSSTDSSTAAAGT